MISLTLLSPYVLAMTILACSASQAVSTTTPPSQDRDAVTWGEVIDPDEDCAISQDGDHLSIEIPGTPHDLSAELDRMNAPRILRKLTGDFLVEVRVAGKVHPDGEPLIDGRTAYNGAGVLVWIDESTYIRLERAGLTREVGGDLVSYANFELRDDGVREPGHVVTIADEPLFVRIERRGSRLIGYVGYDGLGWMTIGSYVIDLPETVLVGVQAINTSSTPFHAKLEKLRVLTASDPGGQGR